MASLPTVFEGQTNSWVYDIFILKMRNRTAREWLCREPTSSPEEAQFFVVGFQEGLKRQASMDAKIGNPSPKYILNPFWYVQSRLAKSVCSLMSKIKDCINIWPARLLGKVWENWRHQQFRPLMRKNPDTNASSKSVS